MISLYEGFCLDLEVRPVEAGRAAPQQNRRLPSSRLYVGQMVSGFSGIVGVATTTRVSPVLINDGRVVGGGCGMGKHVYVDPWRRFR